jgi:3',5'-nucleoside bisphosphate phosphatase
MIDLHTHTNASDGTLTPRELIDHALEINLEALAITDHDTIDGYLAAKSYYETLGEKAASLTLISGIEFSTTLPRYPFDIHILGLNMDVHAPAFVNGLTAIVNDREQRNEKMLSLLQQKGFNISSIELHDYCKGSIITRAHFAKLLVLKGYFQSTHDAFSQLLGNNGSVYVPRLDVHAKKAIELIINAGGIAALAHPTLYGLDSNGLYGMIDELKQYGLSALEAQYSLYTPAQTKAMMIISNRFSLKVVGGSDFHGSNKPDISLGKGLGRLNISKDLLHQFIPNL